MRVLPLAAMLLASCGDTSPPGSPSGPGITGVSGSTGTHTTEGTTTSSEPGDDSAGGPVSTSTGILRDVGTAEDFGPSQPPGCKGKVDVLFVISRLGTMVTEQDQLVASFPGFVDTIEQTLEGFDVHIMTANPDGEWPGYDYCEGGDGQCAAYWPNCGPYAPDYDCETFADMATPCDEKLGAGLIFNVGGDAANKLCDLHGGNRYIISGEPDMKGALECIAKVGAAGRDPPLGDAMIAALSPKLNGAGGCNEGFLREDALLVVVLIMDNADIKSKSHAKTQYEAIVAAKGSARAVVMLAVVPQPLKEGEPMVPGCAYDESGPLNFEDLLSRFPYHEVGDTCAPSYAPFFEQAAARIGEACGSFIPQ